MSGSALQTKPKSVLSVRRSYSGYQQYPVNTTLQQPVAAVRGPRGNGIGYYTDLTWLPTDGSDQSATIQAALNALAATGGAVILPYGTVGLLSKLLISSSHVALIGSGGDRHHAVGNLGALAGTKLTWLGSPGGTMVQVASTSGAGNSKIVGSGVRGIVLDANGSAGIGLQVLSANDGKYEDVGFIGFSTACLDLDVVSALSDPRDTQGNEFDRFHFDQISASGACVRMGSSNAGANPSENLFKNFAMSTKDGDGWVLNNCDSNVILHFQLNCSGSGNTIVFNGSNAGANYVARSNSFIHGSYNAPVIARGTGSFTYPCGSNVILLADRTNNAPAPTVETGAGRITYSYDDGCEFFGQKVALSIGNTLANAQAGYDFLQGVGSAVAFVNNSNSHAQWMTSSGSVRWVQAARNDTGRMSFTVASGTGVVEVPRISIIATSAPPTPTNGDIWQDGSSVKMMIGGVIKTFTLT